MKKGNSQEDKLKKIKKEREFVQRQLETVYTTMEGIGIDVDHQEVTFMVDYSEFSKKKDFKTEFVAFKFDSADNDMMSLKFTYKIIKNG